MTEELQKTVQNLTCTYCQGEGVLASSVNHTVEGQLRRYFTQRPCPACSGTGLTMIVMRFT